MARRPDEWLGYDHHGGSKGEPSFVSVSLTLLMAVLSYHAKDARDRALSSLYDEAFVLVTTAAAVVASLGWRLLTRSVADTDSCNQEFRRQQRFLLFLASCLSLHR
jgi:hypothetical protein